MRHRSNLSTGHRGSRAPALRTALAAAVVAAIAGLPMSAASADPSTASPVRLGVELNKLEQGEKGCRAYLVVDNPADKGFQVLKLDMVLFQPDGIIGKRIALDLAPLKPTKRAVKLFDLDGIGCDKISSVLINDVLDCKVEGGQPQECLTGMTLKSLVANVQISK